LLLTKLREFYDVDTQTKINVLTRFKARELNPDPSTINWYQYINISNRELLMSADPLPIVGEFRNVQVGISRDVDALIGDVFVLNDGRWQFIGMVRFDADASYFYLEILPSLEV